MVVSYHAKRSPQEVKVLQQPELRAYSFKDGATYNVSGTVEGCRLPKEIHCHFNKIDLITNCHSSHYSSQAHLIKL